jgi:5-methylcytosine-specific restriction endonuclease McrA
MPETYYERNKEAYKARARAWRQTIEYKEWLEATRESRAEYKREQRRKAGAQSGELIKMEAAIKRAGQLPSVAQLVYKQQSEYWRQYPEDRAKHLRERAKRHSLWKYMTDASYRLYHRSKSKHRKAQDRGSIALMLTAEQLWSHWACFDHRCAYCGCTGDLQIEHVIPISKGGEHHLGNIVPACQSCNSSKRSASVESWYRSQPFFDQTRWAKLQELSILQKPCAATVLGPCRPIP